MELSLIAFCTAFILQFVGHRVGDFIFQTDTQAQQKATDIKTRLRHVLVYSFIISLLIAIVFHWTVVLFVFILTFLEHLWIDSRKPVLAWKTFLEKKIAGNKDFDVEKLPFFVLIEIDQSIHYVRIFLISVAIALGINM